MLNPLCLALLPLAALFLVGYSYTKRFTWLSHWILGFTDGIAAAGGWIAVRGGLRSAGVRALVRAHRVDRRLRPDLRVPGRRVRPRQGLHSIPARFGIAPALDLRAVCHVLTVAAFALLGWMIGLGLLYWVGVLAVAALLVYEHSLVSPVDLSRLDMAFFNVNGYIAVILLAAVLGAVATSSGTERARAGGPTRRAS